MSICFIKDAYAFYMEVLKPLMEQGYTKEGGITKYLLDNPSENQKSYV